VSLVARYLEEQGMPTVVWTNARDITAQAHTPRSLFTNYPLGNPVGRPGDLTDQRAGLISGLQLLESVEYAGTIVDSARVWSESQDWMRLIFTEEQPFLTAEAEAKRLADIGKAP
jgi:D-proline reductase (dithiol) PrdB